jgi:uncharacterized protein YbjQ (UPF0145 family)
MDWEARLQSPEYAPVRNSLAEIGIYSAVDLLATYAGNGESLREWLAPAQINRDRNLRLQYLAGFGLNRYEQALIHREMVATRTFPAEMFTAPPEVMEELQWKMMGGGVTFGQQSANHRVHLKTPLGRIKPAMIITTTQNVEGKRITRYCGIVTGEAILGANLFKDLFAGVRDIVGGRSATYERELQRARDIAMEELQQRAAQLGANAVVAVDLDFEVLGRDNGMLMVSASGTAVVIEE